MKIIVGLGNPGLRYQKTRHNLGFWVVDELSRRWGMPLRQHKFGAKYGSGAVNGEKIVLVKPQSFMNLSGGVVGPLFRFYQIELEQLMIVYDDLALAPGLIRIKGSGSAGGHKGVADIISHLNSTGFPRLRVGIGEPQPPLEAVDYVLQGLENGELRILQKASSLAADALEMWLQEGLPAVMNHYNRKQNKGQEGKGT